MGKRWGGNSVKGLRHPFFSFLSNPGLGRSAGRSFGLGVVDVGLIWVWVVVVYYHYRHRYLPTHLTRLCRFSCLLFWGGGALVVAGKRSKRESVSVSFLLSHFRFSFFPATSFYFMQIIDGVMIRLGVPRAS